MVGADALNANWPTETRNQFTDSPIRYLYSLGIQKPIIIINAKMNILGEVKVRLHKMDFMAKYASAISALFVGLVAETLR